MCYQQHPSLNPPDWENPFATLGAAGASSLDLATIPSQMPDIFGKFDAHFVTAAYLFVDLEKSLLHYPLQLTRRACWPRALQVKSWNLKKTA
jgi:hypothetical protein